MNTPAPQPDANQLGAWLTAYADGLLQEDGCKEIERLLEERPALRDRLGDIVAMQHLLRENLPTAPRALDDIRRARILEAAARKPAIKRNWIPLVAASVLVVFGAFSMRGNMLSVSREHAAVRISALPDAESHADSKVIAEQNFNSVRPHLMARSAGGRRRALPPNNQKWANSDSTMAQSGTTYPVKVSVAIDASVAGAQTAEINAAGTVVAIGGIGHAPPLPTFTPAAVPSGIVAADVATAGEPLQAYQTHQNVGDGTFAPAGPIISRQDGGNLSDAHDVARGGAAYADSRTHRLPNATPANGPAPTFEVQGGRSLDSTGKDAQIQALTLSISKNDEEIQALRNDAKTLSSTVELTRAKQSSHSYAAVVPTPMQTGDDQSANALEAPIDATSDSSELKARQAPQSRGSDMEGFASEPVPQKADAVYHGFPQSVGSGGKPLMGSIPSLGRLFDVPPKPLAAIPQVQDGFINLDSDKAFNGSEVRTTPSPPQDRISQSNNERTHIAPIASAGASALNVPLNDVGHDNNKALAKIADKYFKDLSAQNKQQEDEKTENKGREEAVANSETGSTGAFMAIGAGESLSKKHHHRTPVNGMSSASDGNADRSNHGFAGLVDAQQKFPGADQGVDGHQSDPIYGRRGSAGNKRTSAKESATWSPREPAQLAADLASRGEGRRTVGTLTEVLEQQWNQQDSAAVPLRILADTSRQVAYTASQDDTVGGNLLAAANRNGAQVVPVQGGIEIEAAQRPLDPTSSFGLSRDEFRAAYGSMPMQAISEDAQQTFAIDDSTASFDAAQAQVNAGHLPDPASIEPQQFYNAVPVAYPAAHGEEAFSLYAEAGLSPFANGPAAGRTALVSIGVVSRPADANERVPLDLVILVDASGSMGKPGCLDRARAGLAVLLPQLDARDRVALVAFSDVARVVQPAIPGDQQTRIDDALNSIHAEGATNVADGVALAYQVAGEMVSRGRSCRVVLATDGAALAGDSAISADAAVGHWHGRGVSLLIVGVGDDNTATQSLTRLAEHGDGQYVVAGSDQAAKELFTTKLMPAHLAVLAKDAKVQMTWNPARVTHARLIGFESRRLAREQYRNDSVAAGNLNQDAQATALFEVILSEQGSGPLGTAGVRYFDTRLNRVVELSRTLPGGMVATNISPRLDLLACAAELGELMQAGWWRNVRGDTHERLEQELEHIDSPFAVLLDKLTRRHHDLEIQDATP